MTQASRQASHETTTGWLPACLPRSSKAPLNTCRRHKPASLQQRTVQSRTSIASSNILNLHATCQASSQPHARSLAASTCPAGHIQLTPHHACAAAPQLPPPHPLPFLQGRNPVHLPLNDSTGTCVPPRCWPGQQLLPLLLAACTAACSQTPRHTGAQP